MIKGESGRKSVIVLGSTTVILPDNCRLRDTDKTRANGVTTPTIAARYKISGILPIWPIPDKEFFGYLRLLPSFSVSERTVSMDSHSF